MKGLVSEEESVSAAFAEFGPDAIAVSISREELEGLRRKEDYDKYEPSSLEIAYAENLETFGEVRLPPPCYVRALDLSEERGVPIVPIDMDEETYSDTFCELVGGMDLLRESMFARRAERRRFDLTSPRSFVIDWDRRVNRAKGFRGLEALREGHMAQELRKASKAHRRILAIVELERAEGVVASLSTSTDEAQAPP